jgi:hypothetical protein
MRPGVSRFIGRRGLVLLAGAATIVVAASAVLFFLAQRSPSAYTVILKPVADAYVSSAQPQSNYGSQKDLRASAIPAVHAYVRFSIKSGTVPVAKATLRLWSEGSSPIGYLVRPVDGSGWDEHTITALTAPPYGEVVAASGPVTEKSWTSVDLTNFISRPGEVTFAITSNSRQSVRLESRKNAHPPELVILTRGSASGQSRPTTSPSLPPVQALRGIIEDVTSATGYRYGTRDDADHSMDSLKVIQSPAGGYLGVYHSADAGGVFHAELATSTDVLQWTYKTDLDTHASQPTIKPLPDGGFLVIEESDNKGLVQLPVAWLRFLHYPNLEALLAARPDRKFDAPHTLVGSSTGAEGTPDVYSVALSPNIDKSTIEVDFHYFKDGIVDQPARGTLKNFASWATRRDEKLAATFVGVGGAGGTGDRDELVYQGLPFTLAEVAASSGAPWEPYLYDGTLGSAIALKVRTHGGSTAFGNPTASTVKAPSGAPALVVTMFIPRTGAAPGEPGELVYFREYGGRPAPLPTSGGGPRSNDDPVIATAGDIACLRSTASPTTCHQETTAGLVRQLAPTAVLPLGDEQYETGTLDGFSGAYDPTWGQFKAITKPVPGNHEYQTPGATGYYSYYGAAAGDPTKGYYSYDLGSWHMIALNGNCGAIGGCGPGSPQDQWLQADLASKHNVCTLAYWHQPRFSSGEHGNEPVYDTLWQDLYKAGADVVLNGHDHDYERFAPQDPSAQADPSRGIREFVVGTGGKSHYNFPKVAPNSEMRNADTFGIMRMTLHARSYDWQFLPEPGGTFTDSGTGACH